LLLAVGETARLLYKNNARLQRRRLSRDKLLLLAILLRLLHDDHVRLLGG
jgi:hypothetical protein